MKENAPMSDANCSEAVAPSQFAKKLSFQATSFSHLPYLVSLPDGFSSHCSRKRLLVHPSHENEKRKTPVTRPDRFLWMEYEFEKRNDIGCSASFNCAFDCVRGERYCDAAAQTAAPHDYVRHA